MYDTDSVFSVLAADDHDRRVASRRALALARARLDNTLGAFLRGAVTRGDFEARFAACGPEFSLHVAEVCSEVGCDEAEHVAKVLANDYFVNRRWAPQPILAQDIGEKTDPGEEQDSNDGKACLEPHQDDEDADAKKIKWATTRTAESGNTDLGGPEPKMDKKLWEPSNLGDPEVADGNWPTERKDMTEPIGPPNNEHELSEIGNIEHQTLPNNSDALDSSFSTGGEEHGPHTDTWSGTDGLASPVTRELQPA